MNDDEEGFIAECAGCSWQAHGPDEYRVELAAEKHCTDGHDTVVWTLTSWKEES